MIEVEILKVLKEKKLMNLNELAKAINKPLEDVKVIVGRMESDGLVKMVEVLGPTSVVMTAAGETYLNKRM